MSLTPKSNKNRIGCFAAAEGGRPPKKTNQQTSARGKLRRKEGFNKGKILQKKGFNKGFNCIFPEPHIEKRVFFADFFWCRYIFASLRWHDFPQKITFLEPLEVHLLRYLTWKISLDAWQQKEKTELAVDLYTNHLGFVRSRTKFP